MRTAWAAGWTFLHLNGVGLAVDFDVDDAEAFMNQVATDADLAVDVVASKPGSFFQGETARLPGKPGE